MVLVRSKPSIFLPTIMFLWGCVTIAMGWVPSYHALVGLRIVVGTLEAGFAPGVLLILSSWYKPNEQAKRFGVYISAAILSGAFGGIIAAHCDAFPFPGALSLVLAQLCNCLDWNMGCVEVW